jgi:hypothetical protein
VSGFVARTVGQRLSGGRPSPARALVAAAAAGTAVAGLTYRLLRR